MKEFLLLFRGRDTTPDYSPEQVQAQMQKWMDWINAVAQDGKYKGGHPLLDTGKTIFGTKKVITDGPYMEGKEMLAGYIMIEVNDYDEAVAIANNCPILDGETGSVEVREVRPVQHN